MAPPDAGVWRSGLSCSDSLANGDDKHAKYQLAAKKVGPLGPAVCSPFFGHSAAGSFLGRASWKDLLRLLTSPNQLYVIFMLASYLYYASYGARLARASTDYKLGYLSCIAETLGLLIIRHKVVQRKDARGISGMTMVMYTISYVLREYVMSPTDTWYRKPDEWLTAVIQTPSVFLAAEAAWLVFRTYKETYQREADILKVFNLLPGCVVAAFVLHPLFREGRAHSILWAFYMYVDAFALLPQLVMMARAENGGIVEAPLAHFVAATAFSRTIDLWFWYFDMDLGPQGYMFGFNFSGYLIVTVQVFTLALMADFMYYYMRARLSGCGLSEDLTLPVDDIC